MSRSPVIDNLTQLNLLSHRTEGVTYKCKGRGALLSLPRGGHREDAIHTKVFEKYIRDNVANWFNWSRDIGLPVERMEDIVLVYGCTMVTSWAAAAFDDYAADAQVSLRSKTANNGGTNFIWSNIRGTVEFHNSQLDVCFLLVTFARRSLILPKRTVLPRARITVSSLSAFEQNVSCFGPDTSGPRQNPFLTTLTTAKTVTYK